MKTNRISRRLAGRGGVVLLALFMAMGLAALVGAACGDDDEEEAAAPTATTVAAAPTAVPTVAPTPKPVNSLGRAYWLANADETPKRGGVFRVANQTPMDTLDRHIITGGIWSYSGWMYGEQLIRNQMVDIDTATFDLVPALAAAWTWDPSTDANNITLKLRKGVTMHDGTAFGADDAQWNLERIRTDQRSNARPQLAAVDRIDIVDDSTIRLYMGTPSPAQFSNLGSYFHILSKDNFDAVGEAAFGKKPAGSGPMSVKRWIPDLSVELEPFADYWLDGVDGKKLPYLDGMVDRWIAEGPTALAELSTNQLDHYHMMDGLQVSEVVRSRDLVYFEHDWSGQRRGMIGFNLRKGPFTDIRLRQAAFYALDHEAQAKAFGPSATPWSMPYTYPYFLYYSEDLPTYSYDPDKAKALVREVDPDGEVEVELHHISGEPFNSIAVVIKSMWDAVGIKTTLEPSEVVAWINKQRADEFEVSFWNSTPRGTDPASEFHRIDRDGGSNWNNDDTPGLEECYLRGQQELDEEKRKVIYTECHQIIFDNASQTASFLETVNFSHRKAVKGYGVQLITGPYVHEVWMDE